jgi:hypothetical protein
MFGGWQLGKTYVFSYWYRSPTVTGYPEIRWSTTPTAVDVAHAACTANWQRAIFRITWGDASVDPNFFFGIQPNGTSGYIDYDDLQIEEGDLATSWSPKATELLPGTISAVMMNADAFETTDFAVDLAGLPTAGAKLMAAVEQTGVSLWAAYTYYTLGTIRLNSTGGIMFRCVQAGTSGASAPQRVAGGGAFTDGGAKWLPYAPLQLGPLGAQVGAYALDDVAAAALTTTARYLDPGSAAGTGRAWYRGNIDSSVNGGAPTLIAGVSERFTIQGEVGAGWLSTVRGHCGHRFFLTPYAASDNHDSLRFLAVSYYDAAATAVLLTTRYYPVTDRKYGVPATDSSNAVVWSFGTGLLGTATQLYHASAPQLFRGYLRLVLHNAFGASASRDFSSIYALTLADYLDPNATIPGAGAATPPSGGGGGGGCPAPWVPIMVLDYATGLTVPRPAGQLAVGDLVWTRPATGGAYGWFPVVGISHEQNDGQRVLMKDGRVLEVSQRHRFAVGHKWMQARHLVEGMTVRGERPGVVARTERLKTIDVVRITIETAATYQTDGLLSHNAKREPV